MGTVSSREYSFGNARARVLLLITMYRTAARQGNVRACWALAGEIEEIEEEIKAAHLSRKAKMITARNSDHPATHFKDIYIVSIPATDQEGKEVQASCH